MPHFEQKKCRAAPVLNRVILATNDWRMAWWLLAGLSTLVLLAALPLVKEEPSDLRQLPDGAQPDAGTNANTASGIHKPKFVTSDEWTLAQALRSPAYWMMLLAIAGGGGGYTLYLAHGVVHLKDLGHSPTVGAWAVSVLTASGLIAKVIIAAVGDRLDPTPHQVDVGEAELEPGQRRAEPRGDLERPHAGLLLEEEDAHRYGCGRSLIGRAGLPATAPRWDDEVLEQLLMNAGFLYLKRRELLEDADGNRVAPGRAEGTINQRALQRRRAMQCRGDLPAGLRRHHRSRAIPLGSQVREHDAFRRQRTGSRDPRGVRHGLRRRRSSAPR